jgi:hypothetical protein
VINRSAVLPERAGFGVGGRANGGGRLGMQVVACIEKQKTTVKQAGLRETPRIHSRGFV